MTPEIATGWDDARERKAPSVVLDDGVVRMREIWVGNLAQDVTEAMLYNHFFIYGEIEKIDVFGFKGFAFVRFKLAAAASRALESASNILIANKPVRISYSDQTRRFDAIGDKPGYEPNEYNAKTLYIQYKCEGPTQAEGKMQEVLNRYGRVRALYIKRMSPNSLAKPCLYVDYMTHEEAENALFHLYQNDKGGLRRQELGDPNIEITYAFHKQKEPIEKPKIDQQNLCIINTKHIVNNVMKLSKNPLIAGENPLVQIMSRFSEEQKKKLQSVLMAINKNPTQEVKAVLLNELAGSLGISSSASVSTNPHIPIAPVVRPPVYPMYYPNPIYQNNVGYVPPSVNLPPAPQPYYPSFYPPSYYSPPAQPTPLPPEPRSIETIPAPSKTPNPPRPEPEESSKEIVIADELDHLWSGFITRNKQNRVGVDAYLVSGDLAEYFTDYNLNITHRTSLDETKRIGPAIFGVVVFVIQNETQTNIFASYIDYFGKKQSVGIIPIKSNVLIYLVPPCDFTKKYISTKESFMLGLLANTNKLPKAGHEEKKEEVSGMSLESPIPTEKAPSDPQEKLVASLMANPKLLAMLNDPKFQAALNKAKQK